MSCTGYLKGWPSPPALHVHDVQGVFQEAGLELIVLLAAGCQRWGRIDLQEPPGEGKEGRVLGLPGPWSSWNFTERLDGVPGPHPQFTQSHSLHLSKTFLKQLITHRGQVVVDWKERSMSTGLAVASSRGVLPCRSMSPGLHDCFMFSRKAKNPDFCVTISQCLEIVTEFQ